jgi:hypothetical protein
MGPDRDRKGPSPNMKNPGFHKGLETLVQEFIRKDVEMLLHISVEKDDFPLIIRDHNSQRQVLDQIPDKSVFLKENQIPSRILAKGSI